ncbi:MAG: DUF1232 domain-containing protein [bacterium]|nr:DUF1232 domain-containing protein [bacterium]
MLSEWKANAEKMKVETHAVYLACRDPRVPWYVRVFAVCVTAYAFSPIDLIPDFIPVLGYLDDLIIIPLGITLIIRMIPSEVMRESRERARDLSSEGITAGKTASVIIVLIWFACAISLGFYFWP